MQWLPIETYDKLKKKPKYAVFFVAATEPTNAYHPHTALAAMVSTDRHRGSRTITHWMPLPDAPVTGERQ